MRPASHTRDIVAAQVASPSVNDRLIVTAHRGVEQLTGELMVTDFRLNWSAHRRVHGHATIRIADPDGALLPADLTDALAVGGSRLKLAYQFGASRTLIQLGTWRIRKSTPDHSFQYRKIGGTVAYIPGGGYITVEADEELASLELDRIDPGGRAPQHSTVLTEIAHLAARYLPLDAQVDDAPIRATEYTEHRLETIQNLCDLIGATYRQTADALEIIPATGTPSDWLIRPGEGGTLITVQNTMDDAYLVNGVTSHREFQPEDSSEYVTLVGRARLETGPLAWDGPFGRVPAFRGANLATTQSQVDDDAATTLARLTASGDVNLSLEALTHPTLQIGDIVELEAPRWPQTKTIEGRVTEMTITATGGVVNKQMALTIAVSQESLSQMKGN